MALNYEEELDERERKHREREHAEKRLLIAAIVASGLVKPSRFSDDERKIVAEQAVKQADALIKEASKPRE